MKKEMRELKNAVEREKKELIDKLTKGEITLHDFVENLKDIEYIENYIHGGNEKPELLDVREIRELAGKTLYISIPKMLKDLGWDKGTQVKIYLSSNEKEILLKKD